MSDSKFKVEDKNLVHCVILRDGSFDQDTGKQIRKEQLHTASPRMFADFFNIHRQMGWKIKEILHIPAGYGFTEEKRKIDGKEKVVTIFKQGAKRKTIEAKAAPEKKED